MECGKERIEYTITEAVEKDGEWSVTVEVAQGDEKHKEERLVSDKGVFGKLPSGKRTQLLELAPKKGNKWTAEEHYVNGQLDVEIAREIIGEERVKVPAGEFDAVVVEMRVVQKGKVTHKTTGYYSADHGVVKSVSSGNSEYIMTSFEKGK